MMKKLLPIIVLLLQYNLPTFAQNVGIGTNTPDASAKLEIDDANRGLLIPRVALTDVTNGTTPINAPATSLLVYNTNAAVTGGNGTGFYYWTGTQWSQIASTNDSDDDWYEVGTTTAPDDINDNIYTQGNVGIGTNAPTSLLHLYGGSMGNVINYDLVIERFGNSLPGRGVGIELRTGTAGTTTQTSATISTTRSGGGNGTSLLFGTTDDAGVTTDKVAIIDNGNMGIGTTAPIHPLHVEGVGYMSSGGRFGNTSTFGAANGTGSGLISWTVNDFRIIGDAGLGLRLDANNNSSANPGHLTIDNTGDLSYGNYPNTRDDATTTPVENLLYTDGNGNMLSAPLSAIVDSTADHDWYEIGTTTAPDDINDRIYTQSRVSIGTTTSSADLNIGGSQVLSFIGSASSSSINAPSTLIINAASGAGVIRPNFDEFRFNSYDAGPQSTVNMRGIDANHTALTIGLNAGQVRNVVQIVDDANTAVTVFDNEGHLGIGMSNPEENLVVNGITRLIGTNTLDNPDQRIVLEIGNDPIVNNAAAIGPDRHFRILTETNFVSGARDWLVFEGLDGNNANQDGGFVFRGRDGTGAQQDLMVIEGNGQVGIGVIDPNEALEVDGRVRINQLDLGTNANDTILVADVNGIVKKKDITALGIASTNQLEWEDGGNYIFASDANASGNDVVVSDNGRVGIGTNAPLHTLDVRGDVAINRNEISGGNRAWMTDGIRIGAGGSDNAYFGLKDEGLNNADAVVAWGDDAGDHLRFIFTASGGPIDGAEYMRVTDNGNLGLGTAVPTAKMSVVGSVANGTLGNRIAMFQQSATVNYDGVQISIPATPITGDNGTIVFEPNTIPGTGIARQTTWFRSPSNGPGTTQHNVVVDGDVGIGTTTPQYTLDIEDNATAALRLRGDQNSFTNAKVILQATNGNNTRGLGTFMHDTNAQNEWFMGRPYNAGLGTSDMFILSRYAGSANHNPGTSGVEDGAGNLTGSDILMVVRNNGNMGLGVLNPTNPIQHSSGARLTAAGVWTNASDRRLKKDILDSRYGLEEVLRLRPVDYTIKKDGSPQVGFIAQEVQLVVPEVVNGFEGDIENGETLGIAYGQLVPVLTNAIQEQQDIIDAQAQRIAELEANISAKEASIEQLESNASEMNARLDKIESLLEGTAQE